MLTYNGGFHLSWSPPSLRHVRSYLASHYRFDAMGPKELDPTLLTAYRHTTYEGMADGEVLWRVRTDAPSPVDGPMAYITAENPGSKQLSPAENERRTTELRQDLEHFSGQKTMGRSVADDGDWPDERGVWLRPIDLETARRIGANYGQCAVLYVDRLRTVRIVACPDSESPE